MILPIVAYGDPVLRKEGEDITKNLKTICKHGNPNVLTKDKGTSKLGQGPIAHSCLIEVELVTDNVSPVTAFDPPVIIRDNKYNSNKYVDK